MQRNPPEVRFRGEPRHQSGKSEEDLFNSDFYY